MTNVKQVLNFHEEATHHRLVRACKEWGAAVYVKMRLADILRIEGSGIDDALFRFALQSHFDFVVADKLTPLFAVEFDGPSHADPEQRKRDDRKVELCRFFGFPLLRITARHLPSVYRNYDLLSWCIDHWFLARGFEEAQERGEIPLDEPFIAMSVFTMPGRKGRFPMWLSAEPRAKIQLLHKGGRCRDFMPSEWIGFDPDGTYRGIAWICLEEGRWVYAESAGRAQNFPIDVSELISEVLIFDLSQKIEHVFAGKEIPVEAGTVDAIVTEYRTRYHMTTASGPRGML